MRKEGGELQEGVQKRQAEIATPLHRNVDFTGSRKTFATVDLLVHYPDDVFEKHL